VAHQLFLEDVRRTADGPVVQPIRNVVLGSGIGVVRVERRDDAVERVRGGRMVREFTVHGVPTAVHQNDGVHEPRVSSRHCVQSSEIPVRLQATGGRVRAQLATARVAPTPVPVVRVFCSHGVFDAYVPHEPDAAVPVVHVREKSWRLRVAAILLQCVLVELEHVLHGDALRATMLHGVSEVPEY